MQFILCCMPLNFKDMDTSGMRIIRDDVYKKALTGEWLLCGKIRNGIDGHYIEWFE